MLIPRVYARDFIPVSYSNVFELNYTPEQLIQIIIGTNGSGKSSLLRLCSPLPVDKDEFGPKGLRIWEGIDSGNHYVITGDYSGKTPHHSFVMNGEELNPGGTASVQTELVQTYLRYNKFLHSVLSGKLSFCSTSPNIRKDLIMKVAGIDFDYAMGMFDKCWSHQRDLQGTVRIYNKKLADITTQLNMLVDAENDLIRYNTVHKTLGELLRIANINVTGKAYQPEELFVGEEALKERIFALDKQIKRLKGLVTDVYTSESDLIGKSAVAKAAIDRIDDEIKVAKDKLVGLEEIAHRIEAMPPNTTHEAIKAEMEVITAKLEAMEDHPYGEIVDANAFMNSCNRVYQAMANVAETIGSGMKIWTNEEMVKTTNIVNAKKEESFNLKRQLDQVQERRDHVKAILDGAIECPNCHAKIFQTEQVTPATLEQVQALYSEIFTKRIEVEEYLQAIDDDFMSMEKYRRVRKLINDLAIKEPITRPVFKLLINSDNIIGAPYLALQAFSSAVQVAQELCSRPTLQARMRELQFVEDTFHLSNSDRVLEVYEQSQKALAALYNQHAKAVEVANKIDVVIRAYRSVVQEQLAINNEYVTILKSATGKVDAAFNFHINSKVIDLQNEVAALNQTTTLYERLKQQLIDVQEELEATRLREADTKLIVDALCPRKGIIADQLKIAIEALISNINKVIGEIWEKDVKLAAPDLDNALDFKFNVFINGRKGPTLNLLSSGQSDVIDLAVSLVVMAQMGLENYPLFLDEVGASFDEKHQDNLMLFIKKLVMTNKCSSVFMISHYASQHGGFNSVDVNVINGDNIRLFHKDINKCLKLS